MSEETACVYFRKGQFCTYRVLRTPNDIHSADTDIQALADDVETKVKVETLDCGDNFMNVNSIFSRCLSKRLTHIFATRRNRRNLSTSPVIFLYLQNLQQTEMQTLHNSGRLEKRDRLRCIFQFSIVDSNFSPLSVLNFNSQLCCEFGLCVAPGCKSSHYTP